MTYNCKSRRFGRKLRRAIDAGITFKVFLNGELMEDTFYVDVRRGVVRCYARKNGRYVVIGKQVLWQELRGKVKVVKCRKSS